MVVIHKENFISGCVADWLMIGRVLEAYVCHRHQNKAIFHRPIPPVCPCFCAIRKARQGTAIRPENNYPVFTSPNANYLFLQRCVVSKVLRSDLVIARRQYQAQ